MIVRDLLREAANAARQVGAYFMSNKKIITLPANRSARSTSYDRVAHQSRLPTRDHGKECPQRISALDSTAALARQTISDRRSINLAANAGACFQPK
jgi:hypothetical protein